MRNQDRRVVEVNDEVAMVPDEVPHLAIMPVDDPPVAPNQMVDLRREARRIGSPHNVELMARQVERPCELAGEMGLSAARTPHDRDPLSGLDAIAQPDLQCSSRLCLFIVII